MDRIDVYILASARGDRIHAQQHYSSLVLLHGRPLLEWVVSKLRQVDAINRITVIGPEEVDYLYCRRYIDRRETPEAVSLQNVLRIFTNNEKQTADGYLLIPGDAVFLTAEIIKRLIDIASTHEAAIPMVYPDRIDPVFRTSDVIKINEGRYQPGILGYAHKTGAIPALMSRLASMHRDTGPLYDLGITMLTSSLINDLISPHTIDLVPFAYAPAAMRIVTAAQLDYASTVLHSGPGHGYKRVALIVNPYSGTGPQLPGPIRKLLGIRRKWNPELSGSPKAIADTAIKLFGEFGIQPKLHMTTSSIDATQIARACAQERYDLVVAAGGDGTIHAIVNGIAGSSTAIGVIPTGTINVFALQLNIPQEIHSACEIIANGNIRTIDLGKADTHYFSCVAGIGYDAFILQRSTTRLKKMLGAGTYAVLGALNFLQYPFRLIRFSLDNSAITRTGYSVLVGNGREYADNIFAFPNASMNDGLLDIVVFRDRRPTRILNYIKGLRTGTIDRMPNIEYYQAKRITFYRHGRHHVHLDGEGAGRTPVTITAAPLSLRVLC